MSAHIGTVHVDGGGEIVVYASRGGVESIGSVFGFRATGTVIE